MPPPITSSRFGTSGELERAGRVHDARVVLGQERQRRGVEPQAMIACSNSTVLVADLQRVVAGELRLAVDHGRPCGAWPARRGRR